MWGYIHHVCSTSMYHPHFCPHLSCETWTMVCGIHVPILLTILNPKLVKVKVVNKEVVGLEVGNMLTKGTMVILPECVDVSADSA